MIRGIVLIIPKTGKDGNKLTFCLSCNDTALYKARVQGNNRTNYWVVEGVILGWRRR
jgi:hypothetical protein